MPAWTARVALPRGFRGSQQTRATPSCPEGRQSLNPELLAVTSRVGAGEGEVKFSADTGASLKKRDRGAVLGSDTVFSPSTAPGGLSVQVRKGHGL